MGNRNALGPGTATVRLAMRANVFPALVLSLLGLVAGGVIGWNRADVEVADATIVINPLDGNPFSTTGSGDNLINMVTESELMRSDATAVLVQEDLGADDSPAVLLHGLTATVPANSQIIRVTYESREPGQAVRLAQSFATQYLEYRRQRAESLIESQSERIDRQVKERTAEEANLSKKFAQARPGSNVATALQAQLDAVTTQINQLRSRAAEIKSTPVNPGQVVTPAAVASRGVFGSWLMFPLVGLVAGLLVALTVALVRARLDDRVHHPDDISIIGHTLLGEVTVEESMSIESAMLHRPKLAEATSAYRSLRVNILTADHRRPIVILVATTSHFQTRPITSAALALTMAASRLNTVLVDAIGSVPQTGQRDKARRVDLSDVLSGDGDPSLALRRLVPCAQIIHNNDPVGIEDAFLTPQMTRLLDTLRERSDIIIIAGGNIRDSRTLALADSSDRVILEAAVGASTYSELLKSTEEISAIGKKLLGVILVTRPTRDLMRDVKTQRRQSKRNQKSRSSRLDEDRPPESEPASSKHLDLVDSND